MQKKQQQQELPTSQNIMATILKSIPKEANITKIDYEGPRIALYTDSPRYLMEHNEIISNLVNVIKKRIVVRTDESIRKLEEDARKILTQYVPKDANFCGAFFDTATGEVSIEAKRPWLLQRNSETFNHAEVTEKTGWKIRVRKATTKPSSTIQAISYNLKISSSERSRQLKQVGEQGGYVSMDDPTLTKQSFSVSSRATESDAVLFAPGGSLKIPYWWYLQSDNKCEGLCEFSTKRPPLRGKCFFNSETINLFFSK